MAADDSVIVVSLTSGEWQAIIGSTFATIFACRKGDNLVLSNGATPIKLSIAGWMDSTASRRQYDQMLRGLSRISPDSNMLALGMNNGVLLVDAATLEPVSDRLPHPSWSYGSAISGDGRLVATRSTDSLARIRDATSDTLACPPMPDVDAVAALTPDGRLLIVPRHRKKCRVFDTRTGLRVCPEFDLRTQQTRAPTGDRRISVTPDSRFVIIGGTSHLSVID